MKQVSKFLFRNGINIVSAVLTFYLLYEDIQLFLSKPTFSSNSESKLQPKNFPIIVLCPFPTFDQESLWKYRYEDGYDYAKGVIMGSSSNGWIGNSSKSVENINEEISLLKSEKDCPFLSALFDENNYSKKYENIQFEMTETSYPNGRCCKAKIPSKSQENVLIKLWMRMLINDTNNSMIHGFQMYFVSQESYHILKLNTNGIPMTAESKYKGYMKYEVRVQNIRNLVEDPKIRCKNYPKVNGYNEVSI